MIEGTPVVLDLPVPPSVNRTRTVNWKTQKKLGAFVANADRAVMFAKRRAVEPLRLVKHQLFELRIVFSEHHTKIDLDNGIKCLIDYLRRIELIEDDGPQHLRKLTVEWGLAPMGARVSVVPLTRERDHARDEGGGGARQAAGG